MRSAEVKNENHLKDPLGAAALCGAHARPCTHSQSGEFTCVCVLVFSVFSTQIWLKLNTAQNKRDSSIMFNVSPPSPAPLLLSSLNSFTRNGDFTFREVCVYARVCVGGRHRERRTEIVGVFSGVYGSGSSWTQHAPRINRRQGQREGGCCHRDGRTWVLDTVTRQEREAASELR